MSGRSMPVVHAIRVRKDRVRFPAARQGTSPRAIVLAMPPLSFGRRALGVALIALGLIALITPFTPGSWLIFVGAEILGIEMLSRGRVKVFLERQGEWFKPLAYVATILLLALATGLVWFFTHGYL